MAEAYQSLVDGQALERNKYTMTGREGTYLFLQLDTNHQKIAGFFRPLLFNTLYSAGHSASSRCYIKARDCWDTRVYTLSCTAGMLGFTL